MNAVSHGLLRDTASIGGGIKNVESSACVADDVVPECYVIDLAYGTMVVLVLGTEPALPTPEAFRTARRSPPTGIRIDNSLGRKLVVSGLSVESTNSADFGPDMGCAISLFRVLHCVCRRPVLLGDLSRSAFLALAPLGATLLINQPDLSPRLRALWSSSNYRGVHLFGNGKVRSVASSKAVFLGMGDVRGDDGVHLALPPAHRDLPPLDEYQLSEIAQELQSRLLMYRLRNLDEVRKFSPSKLGSTFVATEIARNLAAGVLGEAEIVESIAPFLRRLEEDKLAQRGCDIHLAIIEVTWAPYHADREIGLTRVAELVNALLRCRGEILEYSTAEIGWKLRSSGFHRHRNGRGMVLRFSQENRVLLHQLASQFSLNLPLVADCALCSPQEAVDAKRLV